MVNGFACDTDAEVVTAIRAQVHKLLPNWQRPELFFEARSEISGNLTRLLRVIAREPRVLGRPHPRLELVGGMAVAGTTGSYGGQRAAALSLATRVFRAPVAAPVAVQAALLPVVVVRVRRRHRYPLPPRSLNAQWKLAL